MPRGSRKQQVKPNHTKNNERRSLASTDEEVKKFASKILRERHKWEGIEADDFEEAFDKIIKQYAPTFSFSSLYVRLACRYRRHYNTDSICVLRTLANQLGTTPLKLLQRLQVFCILKPKRTFDKTTRQGGFAPFGWRILFAMRKLKNGTSNYNQPATKEVALSESTILKFFIQ